MRVVSDAVKLVHAQILASEYPTDQCPLNAQSHISGVYQGGFPLPSLRFLSS